MPLIREVVTVIALVAASAALQAQVVDDPKAVAYEALSALLLGHRATFTRATLPTEDVDRLLRPAPPSGDERARIDEQLERVRLSTQQPPLFEGEPVEDGKAPPVGRSRGRHPADDGQALPVPAG